MTNNSDGEVYGAKALDLAMIGTSVLIMLGVLWQPSPSHSMAVRPAAQVEQVAKMPAPQPAAG